MSYRFPYEGLRVLDVSQGFAGPYAGGLLSLYGASVVKVEPPEGDWIRSIGQAYGGQTPLGVVANRGKRSIAIDLKTEGGRNVVYQLAETADVFIESFRPGVADRLGISYAEIRARNPRILYLSVSGFGQTGPGAQRPAVDTVIQANSGFMSINQGMDGVPHRAGVLIADTSTGVYAFQALAAALFARERESESEGRHIDISLMQGTAAFLAPKIVEFHMADGNPRPLNAPAGSFRTSDGWLAVTLVKEHHFERLCRAIEQPALARDPRFETFETRAEHLDVITDIVAAALTERTTADWVERFEAVEALCSPIADFGDWLDDRHVQSIAAAPMFDQPGMGAIPVPQIPGTDPATDADAAPVAPGIGEHGAEILAELGLDDAAVAGLRRDGAVRLPE
jgi:crotonobetainyl-CoA:carnitine CoA-transferase CaiB-like acyl-CoA transferase